MQRKKSTATLRNAAIRLCGNPLPGKPFYSVKTAAPKRYSYLYIPGAAGAPGMVQDGFALKTGSILFHGPHVQVDIVFTTILAGQCGIEVGFVGGSF